MTHGYQDISLKPVIGMAKCWGNDPTVKVGVMTLFLISAYDLKIADLDGWTAVLACSGPDTVSTGHVSLPTAQCIYRFNAVGVYTDMNKGTVLLV